MKIRHLSDNLKSSTGNRGFTLIELLVVISIIGMLSSVVFASVQTARQKGVVGAGIKFATYNYRYLGADAFGIWDFNEAGAGTARDTSGNNFNATYTTGGAPSSPIKDSSDRPANSGSSMFFSGSNNNMIATISSGKNLCNNTTLLTGCNGYTMSLWAKPNDVNSQRYLLQVGPASGTGYELMYFSATGEIMCGYPAISISFPEMKIVANQWQHITCSYKRVGASGVMDFYVNGKLIASKPLNIPMTNLSYMINRVAIGNYIGGGVGGTNTFNGRLDDVSIYNRSLTASEIKSIYAQTALAHGLAIDN